MSLKKWLFLGLLGFMIFVWLFFYVLRTKTNDISSRFPYKELVGRELGILHASYLFPNLENNLADYPYFLSLEKPEVNGSNIYKIPIGTKLKIKGAKELIAPVSGAKYNLVLGSVFVKELNKELQFQFVWGENPTYGLYEFEKNYDIFALAPWQKTALPYKYFWDGHKEPHDWLEWKKLGE